VKKPSLDNIFRDFYHPNPNINLKSFEDMYIFWPNESIKILAKNLDSKDIKLRRKSVKAIAYFGKDIVDDIVEFYFSKEDEIYRLSCIKVLVLIASNNCLNNYKDKINRVIVTAIKSDSAEIILSVISLLRQLGECSIPYLKELCRDKNILKAKAAMTALIEFKEPSIKQFLLSIHNDSNLDKIIREFASEELYL